MVFPVVMYGCENLTIEKAECQRIDAVELLCWKRIFSLLDINEIQPVHPKGNQFWIIIGKTDTEVETRILWLSDGKNWLLKRCWFWEELKAGPEGGDRGWDGWMASPTQWTWVWVNSWSWWWTWRPGMLQSIVSKRLGHSWATELTVWYKGFSLNLLK